MGRKTYARVGQVPALPAVGHEDIARSARALDRQHKGRLRTVRVPRLPAAEGLHRAKEVGNPPRRRVHIAVGAPRGTRRRDQVIPAAAFEDGRRLAAGALQHDRLLFDVEVIVRQLVAHHVGVAPRGGDEIGRAVVVPVEGAIPRLVAKGAKVLDVLVVAVRRVASGHHGAGLVVAASALLVRPQDVLLRRCVVDDLRALEVGVGQRQGRLRRQHGILEGPVLQIDRRIAADRPACARERHSPNQ